MISLADFQLLSKINKQPKFLDKNNIMTKSSIILCLWLASRVSYDLLIRCVTVPVSLDSQVWIFHLNMMLFKFYVILGCVKMELERD